MTPRTLLRALLMLSLPLSAGAASPAFPVPLASGPRVEASAPQPRVERASVVGYAGTVAIVPKGGKPRRVDALPAPLEPGDLVATGPRGQADLQLKDGSRVNIGPDARFTVEEEAEGLVSLFLARGKVWCAVSRLVNRRFQVRTPSATAAVRGTEFSVEALGAARTSVEVFGGLVSVRGKLGDEALVGASQRVDVEKGAMGAVQRFEVRPDVRRPAAPPGSEHGRDAGGKDSKDEKGKADAKDGEKGKAAGRDDRKDPAGERHDDRKATREDELNRASGFSFDPSRFKDFVSAQADEQVRRDQVESSAAFEQKAQLYQEGKTLVDAFGRRVRVEEYIKRPTPDSFKFVSFNFRDDRTDFASVEVTANRALPDRLADAGSLWYSPGTTAPPFFAVKQRLTMSNGSDSVVQVGVDGAPQLFTTPGGSIFDPSTGQFVATPPGAFFRTMFGNRYEFVNGNAAAVDDVYFGAFRPAKDGDVSGAGNAASGLMWRTQPVKIDITDGSTSRGSYWTDAFVKYNGTDGLAYAQNTFPIEAGLAHFGSERSYFNFRDTNGNGILDFGEPLDPANAGFFHDVVGRMNGTVFVADGGAGARSAGGDTLIFSDLNRTGAPTGNPTLTAAGLTMSQAQAFAQANPRDWLKGEEFAIDDTGRILPAGADFESSSGLFLGQNFERRLSSSRFAGKDIDVVSSPSFIFQAGGSEAGQPKRPVPSPGP